MHRRRALVRATLAMAVLTAAAPALAQDRADAAAIAALDSAWARAYAVHDTATAAALFDPALVVTSGDGTLKTREEELADVRPHAGLRMHHFRTADVTVRTWGDAAVVTGLAEWAFTYDGQEREVRRRYTAVYIRGGPLGWRMTALHIGPAPAPDP